MDAPTLPIPAPAFPAPRFFRHDGLRLAYHESGPEGGEPLILLHGWPEIAYSWAPLFPHLAGAGFRVVAPDLRGFGASDAPRAAGAAKSHYSIAQMVGDVEVLLDHFGLRTATLVVHDWGGIIGWQAARMLGDPAVVEWGRVRRIASISTPLVREAPVDPLRILERRYGPEHYFLVFNREPEATAELFARDADAFFRLLMRTTPPHAQMRAEFAQIPKNVAEYLDAGAPELPGSVLDADARARFVEAYARSGFHGGIALYRNTTENWELVRGCNGPLTQPALMVSPERDLFLPPEVTDHMPEMCRDLERVVLPGCGHWAMWERPGKLAEVLLEWLARTSPPLPLDGGAGREAV